MEPYAILAATEEEVEAVHAGLRAYNRNYCPDAEDLSRAVRDEAGRVVAGKDCFRMGTLVLVDVLWVDESCRGQGLGARLLAAAETDAMMVVPSALTDFCRMMEPMAVMEN